MEVHRVSPKHHSRRRFFMTSLAKMSNLSAGERRIRRTKGSNLGLRWFLFRQPNKKNEFTTVFWKEPWDLLFSSKPGRVISDIFFWTDYAVCVSLMIKVSCVARAQRPSLNMLFGQLKFAQNYRKPGTMIETIVFLLFNQCVLGLSGISKAPSIECGMNLLIHSQNLTLQPLKFGYG